MQATLTELRRRTGKVLSALKRQKTVQITEHGEIIADLTPRTQPMPIAEFERLWRQRRPLDEETAEEILKNIREIRQAEIRRANALPD